MYIADCQKTPLQVSVCNNTKLTIFSISFATISKCNTASPLMICLLKSTFQKRSVCRVITFSAINGDEIFKKKRSMAFVVVYLPGSEYELGSPLLNRLIFLNQSVDVCETKMIIIYIFFFIYSKTNWDIGLWNLSKFEEILQFFDSVELLLVGPQNVSVEIMIVYHDGAIYQLLSNCLLWSTKILIFFCCCWTKAKIDVLCRELTRWTR